MPLQAEPVSEPSRTRITEPSLHTELLLDHFQDLLLIKLLRKALDGGQGLPTIALCKSLASV